MKKTIVFALVLAGAMVAAFAQESKTSLSTAGVFGNDVDDYLDVHSWKDVQPEKLFGFLGAGVDPRQGNGTYNLGFAKQFGKAVYWGTYFGGDFGDYTSTKTVVTGTGTTQDDTNSANTDTTAWEFNNLIGIADFIGIKIGFKYFDMNSSTTLNATGGTDEFKNTAWQLGVAAGVNLGSEKTAIKPYAGFSYGYNFNEEAFYDNPTATTAALAGVNNGTYTVTNGVTTDTTVDVLAFFGGLGLDFEKKNDVQHSLDANIRLAININGDQVAGDPSHVGLTLYPSYTVKYDASEKLQVGAIIGLPIDIGFGDIGGFSFAPDISAGLSYHQKEKMTWNAGLGLSIISFAYSSVDTTDANGNVLATTSGWDIGGATAASNNDGTIRISTGFNYAFTPKVSLDFNWNVIAGIFSGFSSRFNNGNTNADGTGATPGAVNDATDNFFDNLNLIFRNQISFIVIVKL